MGVFSEVSFNGTLRASYDGVYDLNSDEFGEDAGGPVFLRSGVPGQDEDIFVPYGGGLVSSGNPNLPPGNVFGFDPTNNPNDGLEVLGQNIHPQDRGIQLAVPVRPCDVDPRGCIDGYLDFDLDALRFPEFNDRQDWLREAYLTAIAPTAGDDRLVLSLGRQQIVWGRTDLFRVLDVINPVDFSRNLIFDELEDIRLPVWAATAEYQLGATGPFDDLNVQAVWNFDKFRPNILGQAGTPDRVLDVGSLFRGLRNCWVNGCTVGNFAGGPDGRLATDFPPGVTGIRSIDLPDWELGQTQGGVKVEGLLGGVGWSLNYYNYRSQLPSLRGGIEVTNPFTGEQEIGEFVPAFDIAFPWIQLYGGSADYYVDPLKTVFRLEATYTSGEEFANTLRPESFSESEVVRWVVGIDRDTFIPFLNEGRTFLISSQFFGTHILDHEREQAPLGPIGIPDPEFNVIGTFLIRGFYKQDRVAPQLIVAWDAAAGSGAIAPSLEWRFNDKFRVIGGANFRVGEGAKRFDDSRSANPFPPFTAAPGQSTDPFVPGPGSLGQNGFEPLGRFRAGIFGQSINEDFVQISARYSF